MSKFRLMKKANILLLSAAIVVFSSCSVFNKSKYGCGSNGKNVGAEKLISGDKPPKAKKFKA